MALSNLFNEFKTPLTAASRRGSETFVRAFLNKGWDPNENNGAPLDLAIQRGHTDIALMLLDAGAKTTYKNSRGHTPFWTAITYNQLIVLDRLINDGEDVNQLSALKETAVMTALRFHRPGLLHLLIDKGANVTEDDLAYANKTNQPESAQILLNVLQARQAKAEEEARLAAAKAEQEIQNGIHSRQERLKKLAEEHKLKIKPQAPKSKTPKRQ
jgi:ankyrin repeat protein